MQSHAARIAREAKAVNTPVPKTSRLEALHQALRPEDAHREFLDLVNLFPAKARTREVQAALSEALQDYMIPPRWREISDGYYVQTLSGMKSVPYPNPRKEHDAESAFQRFLDLHFPVKEFGSLRRYLAEGDSRYQFLRLRDGSLPATPLERWNWLAGVNEMLTVWALENSRIPSPLSAALGWKPDGVCCICGRLFPRTRKDRPTCSASCGTVHRQREWRRRKRDGITRQYDIAKKHKQAKRQERKRV